MSSFQPYLIADFRQGLLLDREPWLLPPQAFSRLKNAYLQNGVLKKRLGYQLWHKFPHAVNDEEIGSSGATNYTGTLAHKPIQPKSVSFTDGTQTLTDDGNGNLTGDGSGTIDYDTGAYDITFNSSTSGDVTCDYQYYPGLPIMGIYNYYASTGSYQLLAFDTKRMARYDPLQDRLIDVCGADTWTGGESDYFWTEIALDKMYITNNVDRVMAWDGSSLTTPVFDIDGDSNNDVDCCLLMFYYKGHMVLLRTTENGTLHAQRARWSKANMPEDFTNDGYVDAPTLDWIMGADFIGEDLVVWFERSVWILKYTNDPDLPFRWEQVVSTDGCYSTFSVVPFSDEILALGPTTIYGTDGIDVYSIDKKIPDFVLNINPQKFNYVYSAVIEENRQVLMLYPAAGYDRNNMMLVLNYDDNAWSTFELPGTVIGYYEQQSDFTWDDIEYSWDEIEWAWDDKELQAGYPTTLMGTYDGEIVQLNTGGSDAGDPIELDIQTGWLNPFIKEGKQARLGWVDLLVRRDPDISLQVEFYVDNMTSPYATQTVTFDDGTDKEKVWIRAYAGGRGDVHKIRLYHNASGQTAEIHAIVPYFKAEGRIYG